MRFNWGHGIAIFFSCFVAFMVFLAVKSHQQTIDLVAEDYYAQEVQYGQRMEEIKNAQALEQVVTVKQHQQQLVITFPRLGDDISGQLQLFRPSDKRFDQQAALALNGKGEHTLSLEAMPRGYYRLKIDWKAGNTPYYTEEAVFVQ